MQSFLCLSDRERKSQGRGGGGEERKVMVVGLYESIRHSSHVTQCTGKYVSYSYCMCIDMQRKCVETVKLLCIFSIWVVYLEKLWLNRKYILLYGCHRILLAAHSEIDSPFYYHALNTSVHMLYAPCRQYSTPRVDFIFPMAC